MKVTLRKDTVKITDNAWYAVALEAGVKGGGRAKAGVTPTGRSHKKGGAKGITTDRVIEPRPYLSTALEQTDVQAVLEASLEKIITARTTF
jgi:hypothetical protein